MKQLLLALPFLLLAACNQNNEQKKDTEHKDSVAADTTQHTKSIADGEMKTYYMVFLNKGAKRDQDSTTVEEIQKQHLAHLTKMSDEGKLLLAGPFLDEGDARGICVYNVASAEEAKKLAEEDPAVKAGRLAVEVRPWMTLKSKLENGK